MLHNKDVLPANYLLVPLWLLESLKKPEKLVHRVSLPFDADQNDLDIGTQSIQI